MAGSEPCAANGFCEDEWDLDALADQAEDDEAAMVEVTLLQTQLRTQRAAAVDLEVKESLKPTAESQPEHVGTLQENSTEDDGNLISIDHNGHVCMLCNKPLPDRVGQREYTELRTDCGRRSSETGPSADDMALPAVQLYQKGSNGFCELNFAKSCADAVANKDYLYWPKSLDFAHPSMRSNLRWDARYCQLNGFLERSVVELQHNFTALQEKAQQLCQTKYAAHGTENLTFLDMLQMSNHEDETAPSLIEAEKMAAWNCAMGDLGCDMAMCAYSFCEKSGGSTGLYSECTGWDPVGGMPF
eukprot:CAMPEP_0197634310 /NCGR_PEP_ID=MMETSP1338-20131121/10438_1 /TAXON_ID=43686 ORGANISM="Pelagodinium beii, Strain RCC1491" /NCGR_SAMPLE_ID=MMETSP1338 /ASSEMBLY_ACC=CAM_ASM_000754 /LENGTH=300 /DNA_ID=CAMNT_0043206149 /DNA_START=48 /DNA_END=950 /DNA_ORIENTATION=+